MINVTPTKAENWSREHLRKRRAAVITTFTPVSSLIILPVLFCGREKGFDGLPEFGEEVHVRDKVNNIFV
jgi:hypothetical protein